MIEAEEAIELFKKEFSLLLKKYNVAIEIESEQPKCSCCTPDSNITAYIIGDYNRIIGYADIDLGKYIDGDTLL